MSARSIRTERRTIGEDQDERRVTSRGRDTDVESGALQLPKEPWISDMRERHMLQGQAKSAAVRRESTTQND